MQQSLYFRTGNPASKNNKLNFCWNKNGGAWNSSLPSDIGSLIFINGSWTSPLLPLLYEKKKKKEEKERKKTDNTICMQTGGQTLPVPSLNSSMKSTAAVHSYLDSISFPELNWYSQLVYMQRNTQWCFKGFCWCHIIHWKTFQPEGFWLICLGSCGGERKS